MKRRRARPASTWSVGPPHARRALRHRLPRLADARHGRHRDRQADPGACQPRAPPHMVMVTAYGRDEVIKQAEDSGFEDVLIKPVSASMLFDTAVVALGADRERTETAAGRSLLRHRPDARRARSCWSRTTSSTRRSRSGCSQTPRYSSTSPRTARWPSAWSRRTPTTSC